MEIRGRPVCGLSQPHRPRRSSSLCRTHAEAGVGQSHPGWPAHALAHQLPWFLTFTNFVYLLLIIGALSLAVKTSGNCSDTSFIERPSPSGYSGSVGEHQLVSREHVFRAPLSSRACYALLRGTAFHQALQQPYQTATH